MERSDLHPTQMLNPRQMRADLILNTAADLLQRFGYKRVTIDDVAAHANIGKGTIYLHWKTREALFTDVLAREFAAAIDDLVKVIQQDPQAALPQRLTSSFYLIVMRRPLLHAVYTADLETLGKLGSSAISQIIDVQEKKVISDYLKLLEEYGLIPIGISSEETLYAFFAVMTGFFLFDPLQNDRFQLDLDRRAAILAVTVQRLFETSNPLPQDLLQAAADRTIELFIQYAEIYRAQLRRAYE